ncbi:MAG: hypothetical protein QF879_04890 [Candidatus Latescibacteria bacterium]|nr:hypothetical protein [Candidatus Latescibacterota bacterium]MDP7238637.1 hypothetical protein [Candidatus Latescibacterota bacterium]
MGFVRRHDELEYEFELHRVHHDGRRYACGVIGACGLVDSVPGHCWRFEEENLSNAWNEGVEQIRILERMLRT